MMCNIPSILLSWCQAIIDLITSPPSRSEIEILTYTECKLYKSQTPTNTWVKPMALGKTRSQLG